MMMFLRWIHVKVSIPHRYGKNITLPRLEKQQMRVSIPHRYGKNLSTIEEKMAGVRFPFLIGTVRTSMGRY